MRPLPLVLVLRLLLLLAVFASAALVIEYMNAGDPAFCGVGSGCFAVRVSAYSRIFGVPMPYFGLVAFSVLLAGSLVARAPEHHRFLALAASAGAAAAVALIAIQSALIGAFCVWCVTVDLSAIAAAPVAILLAIQAKRAPPPPDLSGAGNDPPPVISDPFWRATITTGAETLLFAAAASAAIGLPFLWGSYPVIPPTPPAIAELAAPGKLTIVGFTDFQCPFCRKLHPEIHRLEGLHGERVHVVRKMYPLPSHSGALPAAQAYLCAPPDKREAAADWLYSAPEEKLTRAGVLEVAPLLGASRDELTKCMASPETQAILARDKEIYEATGARGLPLTYVGSRMVIGFNPERIESSLRAELSGDRLSLRLSWLFGLIGVIFLAVTVLTWRLKSSENQAPAP